MEYTKKKKICVAYYSSIYDTDFIGPVLNNVL